MERKKSSSLILGAITGFDQALINPENRHLLDVADDPTNPDDESRGLIRRLASAVADKEVRHCWPSRTRSSPRPATAVRAN
ncbi:MAG TPA: hypothetical protein DCS43_06625 [Verrucomicrobia bacterium]|nr:hypothetical protein [Verrucomicrobiota bacterium]